jgi:DNA mismatch repair protein MutL
MGSIAVLDKNMINMIAAGEVIERPASVVKELMENSIDSGATKITVTIEDGGRKLISITDNGCGMDAGDLANAFEPHATSKIRTSNDLAQILTMGFRGEALASISSIAIVKATSRTKDSNAANAIEIDCGQKKEVTPASGDYGTTIQVRDVFYKLPVRRKFLKTANTEMTHITEQFRRIALANQGLDMTLIHNGKEVFRLLPNQGLRQRISVLFSDQVADDLLLAETNEKNVHITALMAKPTQSRTNSKMQYVFLNGRYIRDKFISHAIKEAYRGRLESDRFPIVFLFIEMPCRDYDVNVHPTKVEVRFYNSNLIHSQVLGTLREKILSTDFAVDAKMPSSNPRKEEIESAMSEFFSKYNPVSTQQQMSFGSRSFASSFSPTQFKSPAMERQETGEDYYPDPIPQQQSSKFVQVHDSYIIAETQEGFVIIDQHALHERIMYENLSKRIASGSLETQKLLIPESCDVTDNQASLIESNSDVFEKLGIEIVPFGPNTIAIQSFPVILSKACPTDFVADLIEMLENSDIKTDPERFLDDVLNLAACKAAIKAGQPLDASEIRQLLDDRELLEDSGRCPHGRPTTIKFSKSELEKQFKRT